jgi:predicted nuclease of predicted toxin-antitoxin system
LKLLIDNQLPIALARHLSKKGWPSVHVSDLGFDAASDETIWQYARQHDLILVSKDADFRRLSRLQGSIPPQVIWVRLGNCRKGTLLAAVSIQMPILQRILDSGATVVELK